MRILFVLLAVGSLIGLAPAPAHAQLTPADSASVLLDAARQFEAEGALPVAEAIYRRIVERFAGTPAAFAAQTALARLGTAERRPEREEGGRSSVELQVWTTLYGLWLGMAVPAAFGADRSEPYGLGLLLGGPAGYFAGRSVARRYDPSWGQVRAITLGGSWGTWQGFGWREVLDIGEEEICPDGPGGECFEEDENGEAAFAAMVVGGLAGLGTGALIARRGVSSAAATGANFGSLWGLWFGTATGVLADLEDDDLLAAALVAGNVGLAAGGLGTSRLGWSRDRWRIVSIAGVLGGLAGVGVDLLIQPDDDKVAIAIPLVGSIAGLVVGMNTSRGMDDGNAAGATPSDNGGAPPSLGSLAMWRDGHLALAPPTPHLRRLTIETPDGPRRRTVLGLELFRAVF